MPRLSSLPKPLLGAALAVLSSACVTPLEPCTDCPDVAGTYLLVAGEATAESEGEFAEYCNQATYSGATAEVTLDQSGSALRLTGYLPMEGTLYEDGLIIFNRVHFANTPAGTVRAGISGNFRLEEGVKTIRGRLRLTADDYDCELTSALDLTEI